MFWPVISNKYILSSHKHEPLCLFDVYWESNPGPYTHWIDNSLTELYFHSTLWLISTYWIKSIQKQIKIYVVSKKKQHNLQNQVYSQCEVVFFYLRFMWLTMHVIVLFKIVLYSAIACLELRVSHFAFKVFSLFLKTQNNLLHIHYNFCISHNSGKLVILK